MGYVGAIGSSRIGGPKKFRDYFLSKTKTPVKLPPPVKIPLPASFSKVTKLREESSSISGKLIGLGVLLILTTLSCTTTVFAQLDAPTALSDFAGCAHHTCTWVPWSTHKTFKQGDLTYTVEVTNKDDSGGEFVLRRVGKELLRTPLKDLSASASVVWSDDKKSFAITWSDGGAIGNFHVRTFHIDGDSVTEWPATQQAFDAFKALHWCKTRGDNIQAYRWLPDSKGLVLVLSVYPTGDCGEDLGHTEAYVVDAATGDIQQKWGVKQLNAYMRSFPE
jgi:hypothetical protein